MSVDVGSAIGYLDLDTSKFKKGFSSASTDMQTFFNKTESLSTRLGGLGSAMSAVGGTLTKSVTLPIVAVGTAIAGTAMTFEKGMSSVKAISGATGKEFEKLRDQAIDLGASTSFSSSEVANAMTEMAKAGWQSQQILDGMSGVLDAAAASGESLGSVSTIIADAITGFGLAASDSTKIADLLTQAANSGTIGIAELGESFKYIAPLAKATGLDVTEVTTALSAMSMAGIKGSQAGTSLRTMLANLADPSDEVRKAMEALNFEVSNQDGSFKSLDQIIAELRKSFSGMTEENMAYYASSLAGKEGMSGLLSLLTMTQGEYDELSKSMGNAAGVAKSTAEVMQDNLQSNLEQLGGSLESLAIRLGDYFLPMIRSAVERLTELVETFTNLNPKTQETILKIAGVAAVLGPVLLIVGKFVSAISAIGGALAALSGPALFVIALIAAMTAAFTYFYNTNENFRTTMNSIFADVSSNLKTIIGEVKEFGLSMLNNMKPTFDNLLGSLSSFGDVAAETFATLFESASYMFEKLMPIITVFLVPIISYLSVMTSVTLAFIDAVIAALGPLLDSISAVFRLIGDIVGLVSALFSGDLSKAKEYLMSIGKDLYDILANLIEAFVTFAGSFIDTFLKSIFGFFNMFGIDMKTILTGVLESIKSFVFGAIDAFVSFFTETIPGLFQQFVQWFLNLPNQIAFAIGQLLGHIYLFGQEFLRWIVEDFPLLMLEFLIWWQELPMTILTLLVGLLTSIVTWGIDMGKAALKIGLEFLNSLVKNIKEAPQKFSEWITKTIETVGAFNEKMKESAKSMMTNFFDGLKDIWTGIWSWFEGIGQKIADFFSNIKAGFESITSASVNVSGSYSAGLSSVPYDGYIAELHKGERVLTADEADDYDPDNRGSGGDTFIFNSPKAIDEYEAVKLIKRTKKDLDL